MNPNRLASRALRWCHGHVSQPWRCQRASRLCSEETERAGGQSSTGSFLLSFPDPSFPSLSPALPFPSSLSQCLLNIFHMPRVVAFNQHYAPGSQESICSPSLLLTWKISYTITGRRSVMNLTYRCNHHPIMSALFHLCLYPLPIPQPGQTIGNPNQRHHLFFS